MVLFIFEWTKHSEQNKNLIDYIGSQNDIKRDEQSWILHGVEKDVWVESGRGDSSKLGWELEVKKSGITNETEDDFSNGGEGS